MLADMELLGLLLELGDRLALLDELGERLEEGLTEAELLEDGLREAEGDIEAEIEELGDMLGLILEEGEIEGLILLDGDKDALGESDGLTEALGDRLSEGGAHRGKPLPGCKIPLLPETLSTAVLPEPSSINHCPTKPPAGMVPLYKADTSLSDKALLKISTLSIAP